MSVSDLIRMGTTDANIKHLNMVQDMIVVREVVAGNDSDASILLNLPMGRTKVLPGLKELLGSDRTSPVSLSRFFEFTVSFQPR